MAMPVTFRQLEVFVSVAEAGSFSKAAPVLGVSQVAVSRHIAALEESCGKVLFDRSRGGVARLNGEGVDYLVEAKNILSKGNVLGFKKTEKNSKPFVVRVGADPIILNALFIPSYLTLKLSGKPISIDYVRSFFSDNIPANMKANKLDLYYHTYPVGVAKPEFGRPVAQYFSSLYGTPELIKSWQADPVQNPLPILAPSLGVGFREGVEKSFSEAGFKNYSVVSDIPVEAYLEVVQNGKAAAFFSYDRIKQALSNGVVTDMSKYCPPMVVGRYLFKNAVTSVVVSKVEAALSDIIISASKEKHDHAESC